MISALLALTLAIAPVDTTVLQADSVPVDTSYVIYKDSPITFPFWGFRVPSYNRVDGLALPWGPRFQTANERITVNTLVTYRSHIGELDLSAEGTFGTPKFFVKGYAGRATFTNDAWIRNDFFNSLATFGYGSDSRNYYRADKFEGRGNYLFGSDSLGLLVHLGALTEKAWSTGSFVASESHPFSVLRNHGDNIERANPPVYENERISSAVAGARFRLDREETILQVSVNVEQPWEAPGSLSFPATFPLTYPPYLTRVGPDWTQFTFDGKVNFPTFGSHRFESRAHAVKTLGDIAPPQRFSYLGGSNTLATLDLLQLGGDELFFAEGTYIIPLHFFSLPVFGSPELGARYAAGSAGMGDLPKLIQNVGVRAAFGLVSVDYVIDPKSKEKAWNFNLEFPF